MITDESHCFASEEQSFYNSSSKKKKLQKKIMIIMNKCKGPLGTDFQTCSVLLLPETSFKISVAQNN